MLSILDSIKIPKGQNSLISATLVYHTFLRTGVFAAMLAALIAAMVFSLGAGRFAVTPGRVAEILWLCALDPSALIEQMDERIVVFVRLPRILLAALCGAGLSVGGAQHCKGFFAIRLSHHRF